MLPEVGATELLLIAIVALIVVGPKDLPVLLRKLGQFMAKLRAMASDFRASFDEMARQSELDELRAEVEAMRKSQLADMAALEAHSAPLTQAMSDIDHGLAADHEPDGMPPVAAPEPALPKPKAPRKAAAPKTVASKPAAPKAAAKKAGAKPPAASAAKGARKGGTVT